jgi:hypothetical protein
MTKELSISSRQDLIRICIIDLQAKIITTYQDECQFQKPVKEKTGLDYQWEKYEIPSCLFKFNWIVSYLANTALQSQSQDLASLVPQCMCHPINLQSMESLLPEHNIECQSYEAYYMHDEAVCWRSEQTIRNKIFWMLPHEHIYPSKYIIYMNWVYKLVESYDAETVKRY